MPSPGSGGNSWPWPWSNPNPAPAPDQPLHPQPTPTANPVQQLPAGCIQDKVTRIGASGYDGNTVPQNVPDNNFNTRWSKYGKGSYIQIELEKNDILCAVDIAWHRGDVRINNFISQPPRTVLPLLLSFLGGPAVILIHMNHM